MKDVLQDVLSPLSTAQPPPHLWLGPFPQTKQLGRAAPVTGACVRAHGFLPRRLPPLGEGSAGWLLACCSGLGFQPGGPAGSGGSVSWRASCGVCPPSAQLQDLLFVLLAGLPLGSRL